MPKRLIFLINHGRRAKRVPLSERKRIRPSRGESTKYQDEKARELAERFAREDRPRDSQKNPKRRKRRHAARSTVARAHTTPGRSTMARSRRSRRKSSARRHARPNPFAITKHRRRSVARHRSRRNPRRRSRPRHAFRRNPPLSARGVMSQAGRALGGGALTLGGLITQNFAFSKIPVLLKTVDPADTTTPMLDGLLRDSIGILGSIVVSSMLPAKYQRWAEPFVNGQVAAAGIRVIKKMDTTGKITPFLGTYVPRRNFGEYIQGAAPAARTLAPGRPGVRGKMAGYITSGMTPTGYAAY